MAHVRTDPRHDSRTVVLIAGLTSILPFIVFSHSFHQLYYFHDDWELLDGAARLSTIQWAFKPFLGDSIIPVFKILWIGAVHLLAGSYFGLIVLLWVTHLIICLIFGFLLARFRIPLPAIAFAVLTFGLAWSNIETLGWSMQWCSQLALLFFLAAWWLLLRTLETGRGMLVFGLCLVLSTLSSQRGIISGLVLGIFVLLSAADRNRKIALFTVSVIPSVCLATVMFLLHRGSIDIFGALGYGANYFLLNPLYHLLSIPKKTVAVPELVLYGSVKIAIVLWALWKADLQWRPMLLTLVALDLVNAAALGAGRSQLGLDTTVSWRYQYLSLLTFGPLAGLLLVRYKKTVQAAVFLVWILVLAYPWKRHAPRWAYWRGEDIRNRLATYPVEARFDPSSITAGRARDLEKHYHLH
jgi:hypothetical protein